MTVIFLIVFINCKTQTKNPNHNTARQEKLPDAVPLQHENSYKNRLVLVHESKELRIYKKNNHLYRIDTYPLKPEDRDYLDSQGLQEFYEINLEGYCNKNFAEKKIISIEHDLPGLGTAVVVFLPNGSVGKDNNGFPLHAYQAIAVKTTDFKIHYYATELVPEEQFEPEKHILKYKSTLYKRLLYFINEMQAK